MKVVEIDDTGVCYHVANIDDELESEIEETANKCILRGDKLNGLSDGEIPLGYTWTGINWVNPLEIDENISTMSITDDSPSFEDKVISFMENIDQRMTNIEDKLNS